jgi:hypothetical protein
MWQIYHGFQQGFSPKCSVFNSNYDNVVGTKWFHRLCLFYKIVTSLSVLATGLCMLYYNFYCIFSCCLPLTKPGLW